MAVLHILLGILKIAGILLAVLLGLLLLILSCMLFCPVVYQGAGEKNQDSLKGSLKISWLFRGISLKVWYEEGTHYFVRICGISTEQFKRIFKRRAGKKTEKNSQKSLLPCRKTVAKPRKGSIQGKAQGKLFKRKQKNQKNKFLQKKSRKEKE